MRAASRCTLGGSRQGRSLDVEAKLEARLWTPAKVRERNGIRVSPRGFSFCLSAVMYARRVARPGMAGKALRRPDTVRDNTVGENGRTLMQPPAGATTSESPASAAPSVYAGFADRAANAFALRRCIQLAPASFRRLDFRPVLPGSVALARLEVGRHRRRGPSTPFEFTGTDGWALRGRRGAVGTCRRKRVDSLRRRFR